jgi:hypothetical protein
MTTNIKLRLAASIARLAACAAGALMVLAMAATAASASSTLPAYGVLHAGQALTSPDGRFTLAMQGDGNLVEYQAAVAPGSQTRPSPVVLWHTHTYPNPGARLEMQGDGNAVVYSPGNVPLWNSGTAGHAGSHLVLQDDGNLVIYSPPGPAVWANYAKPVQNQQTRTTNPPDCTSQKMALFGAEVFNVCLVTTDSYNGSSVSGFVNGPTCNIDYPTGLGYTCHRNDGVNYRQNSYWDATHGYWEDWLNYRVSYIDPLPPYTSFVDCVYLRVDTTPWGYTTYNNPQPDVKQSYWTTC